MTKLPKNWCVKVTPENKDVLNEWKQKVNPKSDSIYNYSYSYVSYEGYGLLTNLCYEEISFEDFKRLVLSKTPEFVLPEKWKVLRTPDNYEIINKWFKDNGYGDPYLDHSPIAVDGSNSYRSGCAIYPDHIEITFDQFLDHVVNKKENVMYKNSTKAEKMSVTKTKTLVVNDVTREITITVLTTDDNPYKVRAGYSVKVPEDMDDPKLSKAISIGRAINDRTNLTDMYLGEGMQNKKYILFAIMDQIFREIQSGVIKIKGIK